MYRRRHFARGLRRYYVPGPGGGRPTGCLQVHATAGGGAGGLRRGPQALQRRQQGQGPPGGIRPLPPPAQAAPPPPQLRLPVGVHLQAVLSLPHLLLRIRMQGRANEAGGTVLRGKQQISGRT